MFTMSHFVFLAISIVVIFLVIFLNHKFKFSYDTNIKALLVVGILSEIIKLSDVIVYKIGETFETTGGYVEPESLPFHLCTMQIFFVFALVFFIKSEKAKQVILEFMFPTMCIGAALALLIPTDGTEFNELRTYQYFMYHGYLVGFAVYLVMSKTILITWKTLFRNTAILFVFSIIAIYLNGIMQYAHTNFMFVSRPPIDGLPILNLNQGWHMYYLKLVLIGVILLFAIHFPFILHNKKIAKKVGL